MVKHTCVQEDSIKDIKNKVGIIMSRMDDSKSLKEKEDDLLKKENQYIRELLDTRFNNLLDQITANHDIIFAQNQEMISHQKITNGRVNKAEEHIEEIFARMEALRPNVEEILGYSKMMMWIKEHPIKTASFIFVVLLGMAEIVELIDVTRLLQFMK